jgi:hypothetical protein
MVEQRSRHSFSWIPARSLGLDSSRALTKLLSHRSRCSSRLSSNGLPFALLRPSARPSVRCRAREKVHSSDDFAPRSRTPARHDEGYGKTLSRRSAAKRPG